jgi:AcrR family transcriptional regulator
MGRQRDPDLEQRLLAATWSLLTSRGYDALTLAHVAAEAKAHRTDLYRRWSSKAQLVTDALAEHLPPVSSHDTGTLHGDIRAFLDDLAVSWSSDWIDGFVGLFADLRNDPQAELAFRRLGSRRGASLGEALQRAVERGELAAVPEAGWVGDLLEGPLMHRRMVGRAPLTPGYLDAVAFAALSLLTRSEVSA